MPTASCARQADHHHDRQAARGLAARDDVVVGRARLALVAAAAAELAGEARTARNGRWPGASLVKVPSQTCSPRGFSTVKVTERSRPIRAPYRATPFSAGDVAAVVAIEDRHRPVGIVGQRVARHDIVARC